MTPAVDAWNPVPDVPEVAAPLRAVDAWRREPGEDQLALTARVGVRGEDPALQGHFPGLTVFPGIFVIEALTQALARALGGGRPPVLRRVRSVRFFAPLLAGDELTLRIVVGDRVEGGWSVRAEGVRRDGTTTARIRADYDLPGDDDA